MVTFSPARPGRRPTGRARSTLLDAGGYLSLAVAVVVMSVPLIWMVLASFKQPQELYSMPLPVLPESFDGANYAHVAQRLPLARLFLNSVFITVLGAGLKVLLGLTCAYALVFMEFPYKRIVFTIVLFTLLVPPQITIIPNYTLIASLGWLNTYQGILLPGLASAFGTLDRKSTRLNSSHVSISYAVFCLTK